MFKLHRYFTLVLLLLVASPSFGQSMDGIKNIINLQQEKISRLEDNLKRLIGSIEEQSNINTSDKKYDLILNKINSINEKLNLLENNIKNVTNYTYDLDFALKRIEKHLELRTINKSNDEQANKNFDSKPTYKKEQKLTISKNNLKSKTDGVLGFVKAPKDPKSSKKDKIKNQDKNDLSTGSLLPNTTDEDNYNYALDLARQLDFEKAEKAFKEFIRVHKDSKKQADAQYWLGRVYFAQKKYEEAAIALAEFNSVFPNDTRFQETTLLIAESAVNFAPKTQLCDILKQSLEFMINPSERFIKRIEFLKNEKQCPVEW